MFEIGLGNREKVIQFSVCRLKEAILLAIELRDPRFIVIDFAKTQFVPIAAEKVVIVF